MRGDFLGNASSLGFALALAFFSTGAGEELPNDHNSSVQTRQPVAVAIAPGTVVGDQPPRTWTHLVVKSVPRLASGDLGTLPQSAFRTATIIRTVILADVVRASDNPPRFVLRRVGVGLCIPDAAKRDVVVSSDRLAESGVQLGMIDKIVLQKAEAKVAQGRLAARTPSFALYHGPSVLDLHGTHHNVELYYAFLVEQRTGALRVLVWPEEEKRGSALPSRLVELRPDCVFDCPLNVKAERLLGAVPVSWSFAMESLPPGRSLPINSQLRRELVGDAQKHNPNELEQVFRRVLIENPPEEQRVSRGS